VEEKLGIIMIEPILPHQLFKKGVPDDPASINDIAGGSSCFGDRRQWVSLDVGIVVIEIGDHYLHPPSGKIM